MNRISKAQFVSLMLIGDVFMLFCLKDGISAVTAAGFAAGSLILAVVTLPLIMIFRKGKHLKNCGKIAETVALLCVVIQGGSLFSMLWSTSEVIYIPYENSGLFGRLLIAGLIAAVCVYISSSGIKALARSGAVAAALGALCIATVIISAAVNSDPENLLIPERNSFISELVRGLALSGSLGSFAVLLCFTKGSSLSASLWYFGIRAVLFVAVILTGVLVTGGIMEITEFPIVSAAQLSQPFPVQRIDSLFLIVFSVFAVYAIGVQAAAAEFLLGEVLPVIRKFRCVLMLCAMAAAGYFISGGINYSIAAISAALVLVTVPSAYFIKRRFST